jgi:hypothetical protein
MENRATNIGNKDTTECVLKVKLKAVVDMVTSKNYDYNSLKSNVKEHLQKIESIIGEKFTKRDEAIDFLKRHKAIPFSPVSLAEELDISRNTIYRNDALKDYIEYYEMAFKQDNPYNIIDELKDVIAELQSENTKLKCEAVDTEILKHEIRVLNRIIVEKSAEATRMQIEIQNLQSDKYDLEKALANRNSGSNVSQLKFNK